ncbi:MAG: plastocyanin/azurin family copper-binding protein [Dehalococcoidia bacterium]
MRLGHVMASVGLVVAAVLSGCGSKPTEVDVSAREFSFTPSEVHLQRGKTYALRLHNDGAVLHDWSIDRMPAKNVRAESNVTHATHSASPLHVAAEHGGTSTLTFTPTEAGTYDVTCTEPGHRESGMTARVVVE